MDTIILNLIVIGSCALIGGGIFLFVRRKQGENEQKIRQMAASQGWICETIREPLAWGLRLKSAEWTLEAISRSNGRETAPGSSNISMSTIWRADRPGSTLLIGPRSSQVNLGELGDKLIRQVLKMALGEHANGLSEVLVGSNAFRQQYMVWAQETSEAKRKLTPALQSALVTWKGTSPLIKQTTEGLMIEVAGVRLKKAEEIFALVRLGEVLLNNEG